MWEDADAWDSYYDDYSSSDYYDTSSYYDDYSSFDWSGYTEPSWSSAPNTGFDYGWDSYDANVYSEPWSQVTSSGSVPWKENYTYTPRYEAGSLYNPTVEQMTSGTNNAWELGDRLGSMEAAHFYRTQDPMNEQLANAEHNLFTRQLNSNPILNTTGLPQAITLAAPPAYAGAKWIAQNVPYWLQQYFPSSLVNATPPSFDQIWAGMRPAFFGK